MSHESSGRRPHLSGQRQESPVDDVESQPPLGRVAYGLGWIRAAGLGDAPRTLIEEFANIKSDDFVLPTVHREGRPDKTVRVRCMTTPDKAQRVLLSRLDLTPTAPQIPGGRRPNVVKTLASQPPSRHRGGRFRFISVSLRPEAVHQTAGAFHQHLLLTDCRVRVPVASARTRPTPFA